MKHALLTATVGALLASVSPLAAAQTQPPGGGQLLQQLTLPPTPPPQMPIFSRAIWTRSALSL